jgi:hypothetical protein
LNSRCIDRYCPLIAHSLPTHCPLIIYLLPTYSLGPVQ